MFIAIFEVIFTQNILFEYVKINANYGSKWMLDLN